MKLARTVNRKIEVWNWAWPWRVFWVLLRVCTSWYSGSLDQIRNCECKGTSCTQTVLPFRRDVEMWPIKEKGVNTYRMSALLCRLWYRTLRAGASLLHCNMYVCGETQCDCLCIFRPTVLCSRLTDFEKLSKQSAFVADWPYCTLC
jgi:hypothetical protein